MIVKVTKINNVFLSVYSEQAVEQELNDFFSFDVPGAKFSPLYRQGRWNGKIYLYSYNKRQLYVGLLDTLKDFCKERNYILDIDNDLDVNNSFSDIDINNFISSLNLTLELRDYQLESFIHCIKKERALLLSPTSSGKSAILYLLHRFYSLQNKKTLIIVPTTTLVNQMTSDFISYGYTEDKIYGIKSGVDKEIPAEKLVVISTWQSLMKIQKSWLNQFNCVIVDEAHTVKADSIRKLLEKAVNIKYRFGTTGTLDGTKTNRLIIEGLLGSTVKLTTTKELQDRDIIAQLKIKIVNLNYNKDTCKLMKKQSYQNEIAFLFEHDKRNKFIIDLVLSLKGNTLLLFNRVGSHGIPLYDMIKEKHENTFIVHGGVKTDERDEIRVGSNDIDNGIYVCSYGTFQQGINMPNLHNIVYGAPTKSMIRNLQSIGRVLRKHETKKFATLYDIADNLCYGKTWQNYTFKHLMERINHYNNEQFKFKILDFNLEA